MTERARSRDAGFTLIEMMVVLVVLGLALGLVLVRGPARSHTLDVRTAADEIAEALRVARSRAIVTNRPVLFLLDPAQHHFAIDGSPAQALPASVSITMLSTFGTANSGAITFAEDGSSSGGRIDIAAGAVRLQIGVNWLTGRVKLADAS